MPLAGLLRLRRHHLARRRVVGRAARRRAIERLGRVHASPPPVPPQDGGGVPQQHRPRPHRRRAARRGLLPVRRRADPPLRQPARPARRRRPRARRRLLPRRRRRPLRRAPLLLGRGGLRGAFRRWLARGGALPEGAVRAAGCARAVSRGRAATGRGRARALIMMNDGSTRSDAAPPWWADGAARRGEPGRRPVSLSRVLGCALCC
mmetsp:Transcript_7258/g.24023  ORF Transcript_7258/g.24023 Transcript_7258/m.24023 type:complete len:206 (+) Transcript_7258:970-1587(+)